MEVSSIPHSLSVRSIRCENELQYEELRLPEEALEKPQAPAGHEATSGAAESYVIAVQPPDASGPEACTQVSLAPILELCDSPDRLGVPEHAEDSSGIPQTGPES